MVPIIVPMVPLVTQLYVSPNQRGCNATTESTRPCFIVVDSIHVAVYVLVVTKILVVALVEDPIFVAACVRVVAFLMSVNAGRIHGVLERAACVLQ
jgi:hypothetical protein